MGTSTASDSGSELGSEYGGLPFFGLHFVLELGAVSLKRKKQVITAIEHFGGILEFIITKKVPTTLYSSTLLLIAF